MSARTHARARACARSRHARTRRGLPALSLFPIPAWPPVCALASPDVRVPASPASRARRLVIEERAEKANVYVPIGHVSLRLDQLQRLLHPRDASAAPAPTSAMLPSRTRLWARVQQHARLARSVHAPTHVIRSQALCARVMRIEEAGADVGAALAQPSSRPPAAGSTLLVPPPSSRGCGGAGISDDALSASTRATKSLLIPHERGGEGCGYGDDGGGGDDDDDDDDDDAEADAATLEDRRFVEIPSESDDDGDDDEDDCDRDDNDAHDGGALSRRRRSGVPPSLSVAQFEQCSQIIQRAARGWVARHQLERLGILYVTLLDGVGLEVDGLRRSAQMRWHAELIVTGDRRAATTERRTHDVGMTDALQSTVHWGSTFAILWRGARARLTVRVRDQNNLDLGPVRQPVAAVPLLVSELPSPAADGAYSGGESDSEPRAHEMTLTLVPSSVFFGADANFGLGVFGGGLPSAAALRAAAQRESAAVRRRDSLVPVAAQGSDARDERARGQLAAKPAAARAGGARKRGAERDEPVVSFFGKVRLAVAYRPLLSAEADALLGTPVAFELADGDGGAHRASVWEQMAPTRMFGARRTTVGRGVDATAPSVGSLCLRLKYWDSSQAAHANAAQD